MQYSTFQSLEELRPEEMSREELIDALQGVRRKVAGLEARVTRAERRRRALIHIMNDINQLNKRLGDQRKAMLHILSDYEKDRSRLARQTERLDNSRRALLHILKDFHGSNLRLADSRKAMIHIMGDLRDTTQEIQRREQELRDKQEQLVQAAKLATLGELTTGVAHELNNPLNNIGLFVGNAIDHIELGGSNQEQILHDLYSAMRQVSTASEIISHLRTFGRATAVTREPVRINEVVERALSLVGEQLRIRQVEVDLNLSPDDPVVIGNPIQLEQVCINVLTNARDAVMDSPRKVISISGEINGDACELTFRDTGPGIAPGFEKRIFDPFFTTKEVGKGTGLGLSITYGIIKDHNGTITVGESGLGEGATFIVQLPLADPSKR